MQTIWQKLWFYTRIVLISFIVVNVIIFLILNLSAVVEPALRLNFVASYDRPNLLLVLISVAAISIFCWWLFWTIFRTIKQIRTGRDKSKVERLSREVEEMKVKAARLQVRGATATPSSEIDSPPPAP